MFRINNYKYLIVLLLVFISITSDARVNVRFNKPASVTGDPTKALSSATSDTVTSPKTTDTPGMMGVYTATGTSTILKGLLGSTSDTVNILFQFPNGEPTPGDTFVMGSPLTNQTFPNGQTGTVIPMLFQPGGGGGSVSITEQSTEPDFALMSTGNSIICTSNGDWYYKGNGRRYVFNGNVTVDPDNTAPVVTITTPATDGTWVQSTTFSGLQGTASDDILVGVGWCLNGVDYDPTGVTQSGSTGSITWSVTPITLVEGLNTIYVAGSDGTGQGYDSVTVNVDTVNPVIVAATDSTHNGVATFIGSCTRTELNPAPSGVTYTATGATPASGSCVLNGANWETPSLTPTGTGNVTITFAALDLSGRAAIGTDLDQVFAYSGSGSIETLQPTSDVTITNWTSTGSNSYSVVADSDNNTYTASIYQGQQMFLGLADAVSSSGKTINKVILKCVARNTNGTGIPSFRISTDSSSYNFILSGITSDWVEYSYELTTNPKTLAAWTTAGNAGINAMFIGFITPNVANNTQIAKLWMDVNYVP